MKQLSAVVVWPGRDGCGCGGIPCLSLGCFSFLLQFCMFHAFTREEKKLTLAHSGNDYVIT